MVADVDARSSTAAEGRVESLYSSGNPVSMVSPPQNRWSAEVSSINAEKTRLDLMVRLQDAEKELAQQEAHQDMQQRLNGDDTN